MDQVCAYRDAGNELGDRILISSSMLRTGEEVFLDDLTLSEVIEAIGLPVVPVESGGDAFVSGIIYALMNEYTPDDIVNFGVAASAVKHTIHGDGNITDDVSLIRHVMEMNFDIKR